MTHPILYSQILFVTAMLVAIIAMCLVFGRQIIRDIYGKKSAAAGRITSREVSNYFTERGYVVCTVMPVTNTNKWLVFLIMKGRYEVVTLFTDGDTITGYQLAAL